MLIFLEMTSAALINKINELSGSGNCYAYCAVKFGDMHWL